MGFTQGKWRYEEYVPNGVTINGKEYIIFTGSVDPHEEGEDIALAKREADARLIAAAPEMYQWLSGLLCYVYEANALTTNSGARKESAQDIAQVEALLARIDGKVDTKGGEEQC